MERKLVVEKVVHKVRVDDYRMYAAERHKEEKENEVGLIEVAHACVDPRTVVVHL